MTDAPVHGRRTTGNFPRFVLSLPIALLFTVFAAYHYYWSQFDVDPPGGRHFWYGTAVGACTAAAIAIATGAIINRPWALLLALAPVSVAVSKNGQAGDFHDSYVGIDDPFLWIKVALTAILLAFGIAAHLLLRGFFRRA